MAEDGLEGRFSITGDGHHLRDMSDELLRAIGDVRGRHLIPPAKILFFHKRGWSIALYPSVLLPQGEAIVVPKPELVRLEAENAGQRLPLPDAFV